jgi:hypothetical protein
MKRSARHQIGNHLLIKLGIISIVGTIIAGSQSAYGISSVANIQVYPPNSKPYGLSYGDWTATWWKWAFSIPKAEDPFSAANSGSCAQKQSGPVWFLVGTTGGSADRNCTIPFGKAILTPIINNECSRTEYPNLKTATDLANCASSPMDHVISKVETVDGVQIQNLNDYRIRSSLFNMTTAGNNIFDVTPGPTQAVSDGYWTILSPLSLGTHVIKFSGVSGDFTSTATQNLAVDITYHITISR